MSSQTFRRETGAPDQLPWYESAQVVREFQQALYAQGWVTPFDWPAWQATTAELIEDPARLALVHVETIQKQFTMHLRKERFCGGHLAAMFASGHIVAQLRRLRYLVVAGDPAS